MKKYFLVIWIMVLMAVLGFTVLGSEEAFERSNHKKCIDAARKIGENSEVLSVAVLKRNNNILVGAVTAAENKDEVKKYTKNVISMIFPKVKSVFAEVDTKLAEDILEFSYFIDSDLDEEIQKGRFDFLKSECEK